MVELVGPEMETLRAYSAGQRGTRATIDSLGLHDFADLIIALAQNDLPLPRPAASERRKAALTRARDILQPRLRHGS